MNGARQEERDRMVTTQLAARGIRDGRVLEAFRRVPRHQFVPPEAELRAYRDGPLSIGHGQTISQPYMVALMTECAAIRPGDRVLEIGTGCGYQSAILSELGADVFSIERLPELAEEARKRLLRLGYDTIRVRIANGTLGWPEEAPFEAIIVAAGAPRLPTPLTQQLAQGGRLVIPLEEGPSQVLYVFLRTPDGIREHRKTACSFVPLIGEHGWPGA